MTNNELDTTMLRTVCTSRKRARGISCDVLDPPVKKIATINSSLPIRMMKRKEDEVSPHEFLIATTKQEGIRVEIKDALELRGFFAEYSEEEVAAYDSEVLVAIRTQNIDQLREFLKTGRPLKCSNSFGESLLHLACRRNFLDVVKFLILEAKVPVRIRDDYGRTILHDAAWTCEPNFELIGLILGECPDLLFIRDRRGHTPLEYARKSHWGLWNKFIEEQKNLLLPDAICTHTSQ